MKYIFVRAFLWLAFDAVTVAFRQSLGYRRLAHECASLWNRDDFSSKRWNRVAPSLVDDFATSKRWVSSLHHRDRPTIQPCLALADAQDFEAIGGIQAGDGAGEEDDTTIYDKSEIERFFDEAEQDANRMNFPKGKPEGYYVTKHYSVPRNGFENLVNTNAENWGKKGKRASGIKPEEVDRLAINGENITIPIALMLLDGEAFPSQSRARKSCRQGRIVVHRGPLIFDPNTGKEKFDGDNCFVGRVIDRVYPGDVIGIQCRMRGGYYPGLMTRKPPFELPVLYEDSHFAIVNKPAGIVCYSTRESNCGVMTVQHALPFALKPSKRGTSDICLRPVAVHRLDKPTSGLLVIAKTKPAIVDLSRQFEERRVKKTYTAIINGIPSEPIESSITTERVRKLGVGVDEHTDDKIKWQLIDHALEEKSAVTVWRPLEYTNTLKAKDGILTLVEMKPKTGRKHQLRRHMSWVKECPIVGDKTYGGGGEATHLRSKGLYLCSNKVVVAHPYYNTEEGRAEWETLSEHEKWADGSIRFAEDGTTLEVHASIDLPNKFQKILETERRRYEGFLEYNRIST